MKNKDIARMFVVAFSLLLIISFFLPVTKYFNTYEEGTEMVYLYSGGTLSITILGGSLMQYIFVPVVLGAGILFSKFKNKDIMGVCLLLSASVFTLFVYLGIYKDMASNPKSSMQAGFYLSLISVFLMAASAVTYFVFGLLEERAKRDLEKEESEQIN